MFRLLLVAANSLLIASCSKEWPWSASCYERHTPGYCDVVRRQDLPVFDVDTIYEVSTVYHPIEGDGSMKWRLSDSLFGLHHSALAFEEVGGLRPLHIEFYALQLGLSLIAPDDNNGTLQWNDTAVIGWQPTFNKSEWPTQFKLGQVHGKILNRLMEWIASYAKRHPRYELWSVWSSVDLVQGTQRYFDDSTCHRFTEGALAVLHGLGAELRSESVLCRNYFSYISDAELVPIDSSNKDLIEYYGRLRNFSASMDYDSKWQMMGDTYRFISDVKKHSVAYIWSGTEYFYAHLKSPFVGLWPRQVNQRMILPWQPLADAKPGECANWAAGVQDSDWDQALMV